MLTPQDTKTIRMGDGATIDVRRMSIHPSLRIVMSHGNGLAIAGYEWFWKRLLPHSEVIMFDFRNHGQNPRVLETTSNNWKMFASDFDEILAAIDEIYGRKASFGVFHSMSALTCLIHMTQHPSSWEGLVLFEPPAVPPAIYPERDATLRLHHDLAKRTRTRRATFDNPSQLEASFAKLLMFQRMPIEVRQQLAESTLRVGTDGKFHLSCPPDFEADTFCVGDIEPHWDSFARIDRPVLIISSDPASTDTPILSNISRRLAADFPFDHKEFADAGHMVQLDFAEQCADLTLKFIERHLPR